MCIVCGSGSAHLLRAIVNRGTAPSSAPRFAARVVAPPVVPPLDPASRAGLEGPADVILRGGAIITMAEAATTSDAIAVRAGRIQAVGDAADVFAHRGRLTRVIDLQGRTLLPGFVNAHWHMPFTLLCDWVDARGMSPNAALAALALAAENAAPDEWLVLGTGTAFAVPPDALEAAAGSHPALIAASDGRIIVGNAAAMESGAAPRHLSDLLGKLVARVATSPDPAYRRLTALLRQTAATGVTCLRVCGLGTLAGIGDLDLLRTAADNSPPLRLRTTLDAALLPDWTALHLSPGFGDDMFRVDTFSLWPGDARASLAATLRTTRAAGWQATIHAADADQVKAALDAYAGATPADARCGLECRSLPDTSQLADLRQLGLSLGLTRHESEPAVPMPDLPQVPTSFGLDAAIGPSAPLRMFADARQAGVPPRRALAALTTDAAQRCGANRILGSLEPGKYADFVFLDGDPRTAPAPAALHCCATWVGGREAFRA